MKKVALITGASKGLGFETSKQLGEKGYTVIVSARTEAKAREAAEKLKEANIDAIGVAFDVNNNKDVEKLVKFISEKFGKLDLLVNNAGIQKDFSTFLQENSAESVSLDILRETFETNFFAVVSLTQALLPLIKKSEAGRIVNVSSIMGSLTLHADKDSQIYGVKPFAYDASKTALNQFTVHLAAALKDTNVKVNAAHPGWVKTDLGGDYAPMTVVDGAKTMVDLSLIDDDGPNGKFIHLGEQLPW